MDTPVLDMKHRDYDNLLSRARLLSWEKFGKRIVFYLPGMIRYGRDIGRYPAISITGDRCFLSCDHCNSKILKPMIYATTPEEFIRRCLILARNGFIGCLVSGGSSSKGKLPWGKFFKAIEKVKNQTELKISVHTGLLDRKCARRLKEVGVDQALIDVVGDENTLREVCHLDITPNAITQSLEALSEAKIPIVPHIVVGLHYGKIKGEFRALQMIKPYTPATLVIVSLMPLPDTPMEKVQPPLPQEVARVIATARIMMPETLMSLGCARPRNNLGEQMELLALEAGVNRMALQCQTTVKRAQMYGLEIRWQKTCCSVDSWVKRQPPGSSLPKEGVRGPDRRDTPLWRHHGRARQQEN